MAKSTNVTKRKIIWAGYFPVSESNIGDHAQKFAIHKWFQNAFPECQIEGFDRSEIGNVSWDRIKSEIKPDDIVFIHSSGDFGSLHHFPSTEYGNEGNYRDRGYSWHDIRKKIVLDFPNNSIIHFPTAVYYEENRKGKKTLEEDKEFFFHRNNFLLMCREYLSYKIATKELECPNLLFPCFTLYLMPEELGNKRERILLSLRTDQESKFSKRDKKKIVNIVKGKIPEAIIKDVQKLEFPIVDAIAEKFFKNLFSYYQRFNLVITDRMHGMIFSVLNKTPCIAFDDKIPHKCSGHKHYLSKSVRFVDDIRQLPIAIDDCLREPYQSTNLNYLFRNIKDKIITFSKRGEIG